MAAFRSGLHLSPEERWRLCTTDSKLVERLLASGMMGDGCGEEDHDAVLQWKKTLDADILPASHLNVLSRLLMKRSNPFRLPDLVCHA